MQGSVGLIAGTGTGSLVAALGGQALAVPTSHGIVRARRVVLHGLDIVAVQRHASGHRLPPHRVNYLAVAEACRRLGLRGVFSTAAVGSLRPDWGPGTLVACRDFVDFTCRRVTAFHSTVEHTDFTEPFDPEMAQHLAANEDVHDGGVYGGGDGPRYETPAEIRMLHKLGVDVVGMTASSEAIAMRENGVRYACIAIVTNLAAGISETKLSHAEVVMEMQRSGPRALEVIVQAAKELLA
ncbi:MAG: S-methyl-5'-thioinosine phosphorylase [Fimbriimonadaceae bacterium]|nr:S-methyl-5'-thioinosine phosphorylase [Fimbriimonadaceae bacterium]